MTYDDIPHLSAKIKPKQQKVGLPCLVEVEEGRGDTGEMMVVGRSALWGLEAQRRSDWRVRRTVACRALQTEERKSSQKEVWAAPERRRRNERLGGGGRGGGAHAHREGRGRCEAVLGMGDLSLKGMDDGTKRIRGGGPTWGSCGPCPTVTGRCCSGSPVPLAVQKKLAVWVFMGKSLDF